MMAEEKASPTPKNFTQMSAEDMHALIEKEGKNFITQTEEGDIPLNDYLASEGFDLTRLMNLFFAFEYFERSNPSQKNYDGRYGLLYEIVYTELGKLLGNDLYGPEYVIGL
jgi:hypothetical protein